VIGRVEDRVRVREGGVRLDQQCELRVDEAARRGALPRADRRERAEVVVNQRLTADAEDLAVGLRAVALGGLDKGAVLEPGLRARTFTNQKAEAAIGVRCINSFTPLGMPVSVKIT